MFGFGRQVKKGRLKMQDLFTQALGINSPWFIKDVSFDNKQLTNNI
jgi:hypothetical protein